MAIPMGQPPFWGETHKKTGCYKLFAMATKVTLTKRRQAVSGTTQHKFFPGISWTAEKDVAIIEMYHAKISATAIGAVWGYSKTSILKRFKKLGLKSRVNVKQKTSSGTEVMRLIHPPKPKLILRNCLNCDKKFGTESKYLRLCPDLCRERYY